jgi:predicted RNA-binding Zn-ribbon protein involved in translation (DUF1610 family)
MGNFPMQRYKNDPWPLKTKFPSTCAKCGRSLPKGSEAYYWPSSRKVFCPSCGEADYRQFLESAQDEEFYQNQYGHY